MLDSTPIIVGVLAFAVLLAGAFLSMVAAHYANNFAFAFSRLVQGVAILMLSFVLFYCTAIIWDNPGEIEPWRLLTVSVMVAGLGCLALWSARSALRYPRWPNNRTDDGPDND